MGLKLISQSALTTQRPDIWAAVETVAEQTTGYQYLHKAPLVDGTIYACGGYGYYSPPPDPKVEIRRKIEKLQERKQKTPSEHDNLHKLLDEAIKEEKEKLEKLGAVSVFVPEGAVEWILHELGHWVAADEQERQQPNYGLKQAEWGHDAERELEAWAFQEIIMAPWGRARDFTPPSQRDGVGFKRQIEHRHFRHVELQIQHASVDIDRIRSAVAPWVVWGQSLLPGYRPWEKPQ